MKTVFVRILAVAILVAMISLVQKAGVVAQQTRATGSRPDLSGVWTYAIDQAPVTLKKTDPSGSVTIRRPDQSARYGDTTSVPGVRPSTASPSYKPEFQTKVKELDARQSKVDPVFYCGKPGVPRIGPPRKIVQLPDEIIFFYEDISGDPYRIIPTDGRSHRPNANPSHYGDSVGRWEGNTLVVDVRNFVEDTWFGEYGYFHTDAMRVIERLWKIGENLVWQATVEDPNVLVAPWVMPARLIKPSTEPLEESPKCIETDGPRLLNDDHHLQR
jgi:hypothetical protein